jgi:hypothetical protein
MDSTDRITQLTLLRAMCDQLADAFIVRSDPRSAELFRARADGASRLLADGFVQSDLNELGGQFPSGPAWLHPRAIDVSPLREPWQRQIARLHATATALAGELRSIGTTVSQESPTSPLRPRPGRRS